MNSAKGASNDSKEMEYQAAIKRPVNVTFLCTGKPKNL